MKAPSSVKAQTGKGDSGLGKSASRSGGSNQGKCSGTNRRYSAHPRKQGQ